MGDFHLPVRRPFFGTDLRHVPVHVPFHIGNGNPGKNAAERFDDILADILARKVQDQLVPGQRPPSPFDMQTPIGVLFVQLAFRGYHFRFHPKPEFQTEIVHPFGQACQAVGQLSPVFLPIPEGSGVIVPFPEPAVIQDEQFDPEFGCGFGDFHEFFFIEVEISGLPIVHQNRPFFVPVNPPRQPGPV